MRDDLHVLCRLLLDDGALSAAASDPPFQRRVWALAVESDAQFCLAWRVRDAGSGWSDDIRSRARAALADAAALEEVRRRELIAVTSALSRAGLDALLLKGSALAYQVYPHPMLRPRDDTDLFIRSTDVSRASKVLLARGYEAASENTAAMATAQRHFLRIDTQDVEHHLDVHWRVTNPLVYAEALPFDRVWSRSVAIAPLERGRGLSAVDALLLACLHRVAHHGDDSSLIWVYDIHLLATQLRRDDWEELVREASANALCGACRHGLVRSSDLFGTPVPADVPARLASATRPEERAFSGGHVSALGMLVSDWQALDTWSGRLRLIGAHVFPDRAYIASKYGTENPVLLPFLYAYRALVGLPRWLARSR